MDSAPTLVVAPMVSVWPIQEKPVENVAIIPAQKDHDYRDYSHAPEHVVRFYHENHRLQTYEFASSQARKYGALDSGLEMGIWYLPSQFPFLILDLRSSLTPPSSP